MLSIDRDLFICMYAFRLLTMICRYHFRLVCPLLIGPLLIGGTSTHVFAY